MLLDNLNGPYLGSINIYAAKVGGGAGGADLFKTVSATAFLPPAWQTFSYDADGNILSDGVWNYMWDAENRLIAVETMSQAITTIGAANARRLEFKYDHLGRRIEKLVRAGWNGSTYATVATQRRFLYDGWNVIAEYSVSGNVLTLVRTMTWGLDIATDLTKSGGVGALLQIADHSLGKAYFPAYDGNGNVAALFDGASTSGGTMAAAYEYSPYGEFQRCEGTYAKENPFRFSTKFTDDETRLVFYGRRYYSPSQGQFFGRDPKAEQGGLHLYAFVVNNPSNRIDYLGMTEMMNPYNVGAATRTMEIRYPNGCVEEWTEVDMQPDPAYGFPPEWAEVTGSRHISCPAGVNGPDDDGTNSNSSGGSAGNSLANQGTANKNPSSPCLSTGGLAGAGAAVATLPRVFGANPVNLGPLASAVGRFGAWGYVLMFFFGASGDSWHPPTQVNKARPIIPGLTPQDVGFPGLGTNGIPDGWIPSPTVPGAYIPPGEVNTPSGQPPMIIPDPNHPNVNGIPGPHTDWVPGDGTGWRVFPDGSVQPKNSAADKAGKKKVEEKAKNDCK
jgi:RHS repeat-associated protein